MTEVAIETADEAGQALTMRAEMRPLDSLAPYARNARKHSAAQVDKIVASIREFGFTNPMLIDVSAGSMIVAGHGRRLAALKLIKAGAAIRMPSGETLPAGMVPTIDCSGWSEAKRRAYILADNRLAEDATWDEALLAEELAAISEAAEFDLGSLGFDTKELDALLHGDDGGSREGEDETPEPPVVPASRAGDLWLLGSHRLACGSSTDAAHVARLLGAVKPHLMVTDPPYGVEYDAEWRNKAARSSKGMGNRALGAGAVGKVLNDDQADWREAWALFPGDVAYIWHAGLFAGVVAESLQACGFNLRSQIIWAKSQFAIGRGDYHWHHEPCWYAVREGRKGHYDGGRKQTTLWQIDKPRKSETGHSTQKPVECMRRPIINNSSVGQVVYDPFLGSGTTLIAAETEGRFCFGSELNPAYVDVIVRRWQEFTGGQATLDGDGRTFAEIAAERLGGVAAAEAA